MSDIKLNMNKPSPSYRDFELQNGDLVLTSGLAEIQQNILQRLSVFFGEWFMNVQIGIPYFDKILVKNPDQGEIDALLTNTIQSVPGVIGLLSYSFSPDFVKRTLNVAFSAQTTQGKVDYEGLITA